MYKGLKIEDDVMCQFVGVYVPDMNNVPSKRDMVDNLLIMLQVVIEDDIQLTRKTRNEELEEISHLIKSL